MPPTDYMSSERVPRGLLLLELVFVHEHFDKKSPKTMLKHKNAQWKVRAFLTFPLTRPEKKGIFIALNVKMPQCFKAF